MTASMLVPAVAELPGGILRAQLPTPFPVGTVNCYLLLGPTVAMVDPGMMWRDSTSQVEAVLAEAGITPAGFVLIGVGGHSKLYYGDPDREKIVEMHASRPAASAG